MGTNRISCMHRRRTSYVPLIHSLRSQALLLSRITIVGHDMHFLMRVFTGLMEASLREHHNDPTISQSSLRAVNLSSYVRDTGSPVEHFTLVLCYPEVSPDSLARQLMTKFADLACGKSTETFIFHASLQTCLCDDTGATTSAISASALAESGSALPLQSHEL
jgi:hypothetical protein